MNKPMKEWESLELERERGKTADMKELSNRHLRRAQNHEELLLRAFITLAELPGVSMALELSEYLCVKNAAEARQELNERCSPSAEREDGPAF